MNKRYRVLFAALVSTALFVTFSSRAQAQSSAADFTVQASATVQENPPSITLHWLHDAKAQSYAVMRRDLGVTGYTNWEPAHTVPGTDSTYKDANVTVGNAYEYKIMETAKADTVYYAYGFVASGIRVPAAANLGKVILIVDNTYAGDLAMELTRLVQDLQGEGWQVTRHDVDRTASVTSVKDLITNDYNDDVNTRTVFLFGHVPVPYSGDIAPDGHTPGNGNHQGAWPADVFYGQISDFWTDDVVNDVTAGRDANRNVPGDGKYDQSQIPDDVQLEVGRVDMANMTSFALSEKELLRQYLNKDHAFRTSQKHVANRALVDINFGVFTSYDVPGEDAWRNFPPLVGRDNIVNFHQVQPSATDWFGYIDTAEYLWAYGCGAGSYNSCAGVGTTNQYATNGSKSLFNMLFGSFFGDWDAPDDLTRAPLATNTGLTSCWVSRPFWFFHPLGIGQTFGYCTRLTQNNTDNAYWIDQSKGKVMFASDYVWGYGLRGVHVALMGDPTLRMSYDADPPTSLAAVQNGGSVDLQWTASTRAVDGYNVYRASKSGGSLQLLTPTPVTGTTFHDSAPKLDTNIYVVRAAVVETSPSGSYLNESGGATQSINVVKSGVVASSDAKPSLSVRAMGEDVTVTLTSSLAVNGRLSLVDIAGRELAVIAEGWLPTGSYSYRLDRSMLSANGVYFLRFAAEGSVTTEKFIVTR